MAGNTAAIFGDYIGVCDPPKATSSTGGGQSHDHTLSANFVGSSTDNLPPYLVLIYIIKT